jgi:hypothetical protein
MLGKANFDIHVAMLVARADELRAAGVLRIRIGEFEADLAPAPPPEPDIDHGEPDEYSYPSDPLDDPALYHDGRVPGFPERSKP